MMNAAPEKGKQPGPDNFADEYDEHVACPWCESTETHVVSPFGGTVSEVLFKCRDCESTFGWMKWENRIPK
jgi:hypothetical protein